jgi:hypothetical protein
VFVESGEDLGSMVYKIIAARLPLQLCVLQKGKYRVGAGHIVSLKKLYNFPKLI